MPQNRIAGILEESQSSQDLQTWEEYIEEPVVACQHKAVSPMDIVQFWETTAPAEIRELAKEISLKWQEAVSLEAVQREIALLKDRMANLEHNKQIIVPLENLAPDLYRFLSPISAVVRAEQDEYLATWFDANLTASGSTPEEAITNLKDIIVASYESLQGHREDQLGPGSMRKFRVLTKYIAKSE